jgi:hypothetical protein
MQRYAVHMHNTPAHCKPIDVTRTYAYKEQALAAYNTLALCHQVCELLECSNGGFMQITPTHVLLLGHAFIVSQKTS